MLAYVMEYIAIIVVAVIALPLIYLLARGGAGRPRAGSPGNTIRTEPSADEPTPVSGRVNEIAAEDRHKVPPS